MSGVAAVLSTVYRGGGRRWLTLKAACNAEARKQVRRMLRTRGDEWLDDEERFRRIVGYLAERHRRQFAAPSPQQGAAAHD